MFPANFFSSPISISIALADRGHTMSAGGHPVKQAAKLAHAITGAGKNALYELALSLKT